MNFTQLALVFLGGGIGASMRWLLSASAVRFLGTAFPAGTFAVNLIGCFLMGLVVEYWSCLTGIIGKPAALSHYRTARRLHDVFVFCA